MAYAARHNIAYSPTEPHAITLAAIKEAARESAISFRKGDILLVRSGIIKWYNECTDSQTRDNYFQSAEKTGVGVAPAEDTIAWVQDTGFAAVAGDALAWEPIPYPADKLCKCTQSQTCICETDYWTL